MLKVNNILKLHPYVLSSSHKNTIIDENKLAIPKMNKNSIWKTDWLQLILN